MVVLRCWWLWLLGATVVVAAATVVVVVVSLSGVGASHVRPEAHEVWVLGKVTSKSVDPGTGTHYNTWKCSRLGCSGEVGRVWKRGSYGARVTTSCEYSPDRPLDRNTGCSHSASGGWTFVSHRSVDDPLVVTRVCRAGGRIFEDWEGTAHECGYVGARSCPDGSDMPPRAWWSNTGAYKVEHSHSDGSCHGPHVKPKCTDTGLWRAHSQHPDVGIRQCDPCPKAWWSNTGAYKVEHAHGDDACHGPHAKPVDPVCEDKNTKTVSWRAHSQHPDVPIDCIVPTTPTVKKPECPAGESLVDDVCVRWCVHTGRYQLPNESCVDDPPPPSPPSEPVLDPCRFASVGDVLGNAVLYGSKGPESVEVWEDPDNYSLSGWWDNAGFVAGVAPAGTIVGGPGVRIDRKISFEGLGVGWTTPLVRGLRDGSGVGVDRVCGRARMELVELRWSFRGDAGDPTVIAGDGTEVTDFSDYRCGRADIGDCTGPVGLRFATETGPGAVFVVSGYWDVEVDMWSSSGTADQKFREVSEVVVPLRIADPCGSFTAARLYRDARRAGDAPGGSGSRFGPGISPAGGLKGDTGRSLTAKVAVPVAFDRAGVCGSVSSRPVELRWWISGSGGAATVAAYGGGARYVRGPGGNTCREDKRWAWIQPCTGNLYAKFAGPTGRDARFRVAVTWETVVTPKKIGAAPKKYVNTLWSNIGLDVGIACRTKDIPADVTVAYRPGPEPSKIETADAVTARVAPPPKPAGPGWVLRGARDRVTREVTTFRLDLARTWATHRVHWWRCDRATGKVFVNSQTCRVDLTRTHCAPSGGHGATRISGPYKYTSYGHSTGPWHAVYDRTTATKITKIIDKGDPGVWVHRCASVTPPTEIIQIVRAWPAETKPDETTPTVSEPLRAPPKPSGPGWVLRNARNQITREVTTIRLDLSRTWATHTVHWWRCDPATGKIVEDPQTCRVTLTRTHCAPPGGHGTHRISEVYEYTSYGHSTGPWNAVYDRTTATETIDKGDPGVWVHRCASVTPPTRIIQIVRAWPAETKPDETTPTVSEPLRAPPKPSGPGWELQNARNRVTREVTTYVRNDTSTWATHTVHWWRCDPGTGKIVKDPQTCRVTLTRTHCVPWGGHGDTRGTGIYEYTSYGHSTGPWHPVYKRNTTTKIIDEGDPGRWVNQCHSVTPPTEITQIERARPAETKPDETAAAVSEPLRAPPEPAGPGWELRGARDRVTREVTTYVRNDANTWATHTVHWWRCDPGTGKIVEDPQTCRVTLTRTHCVPWSGHGTHRISGPYKYTYYGHSTGPWHAVYDRNTATKIIDVGDAGRWVDLCPARPATVLDDNKRPVPPAVKYSDSKYVRTDLAPPVLAGVADPAGQGWVLRGAVPDVTITAAVQIIDLNKTWATHTVHWWRCDPSTGKVVKDPQTCRVTLTRTHCTPPGGHDTTRSNGTYEYTSYGHSTGPWQPVYTETFPKQEIPGNPGRWHHNCASGQHRDQYPQTGSTSPDTGCHHHLEPVCSTTSTTRTEIVWATIRAPRTGEHTHPENKKLCPPAV